MKTVDIVPEKPTDEQEENTSDSIINWEALKLTILVYGIPMGLFVIYYCLFHFLKIIR